MKMIIAFAALVAVAIAAPSADSETFVQSETPLDNIGTGDYKYGFTLSNGATKEESARFVEDGPEGPAPEVVGSYSWVDPKTNVQYAITYTAGKAGFNPEGAHLVA